MISYFVLCIALEKHADWWLIKDGVFSFKPKHGMDFFLLDSAENLVNIERDDFCFGIYRVLPSCGNSFRIKQFLGESFINRNLT